MMLPKDMLSWEFYNNGNAVRVFIHLLLKSDGEKVITTLSLLSKDLGLSKKQIRVALNLIEKSGKIISKKTNKNTVILVNNINLYNSQEQEKRARKRARKTEVVTTSEDSELQKTTEAERARERARETEVVQPEKPATTNNSNELQKLVNKGETHNSNGKGTQKNKKRARKTEVVTTSEDSELQKTTEAERARKKTKKGHAKSENSATHNNIINNIYSYNNNITNNNTKNKKESITFGNTKERKRKENENEKIIRRIETEGYKFAKWFKNELLDERKKKRVTSHDLRNWADCYDKLIKRGYKKMEIVRLCIWARKNEFWATNFYSPCKLTRKSQKMGITYIEKFIEDMEKEEKFKEYQPA